MSRKRGFPFCRSALSWEGRPSIDLRLPRLSAIRDTSSGRAGTLAPVLQALEREIDDQVRSLLRLLGVADQCEQDAALTQLHAREIGRRHASGKHPT
jgi:hypothetical protein